MTDLLTISALAAEFGRDRRTVTQLLRAVEPAETATFGGKVTKRYRREDVAAILKAPSIRAQIAAAFEELHAARATVLELKRALRTGDSLIADDVRRESDGRILNCRSACLALESRFGAEIKFALEDPKPLAELRRIFRRATREITDDLKQPWSWSKK